MSSHLWGFSQDSFLSWLLGSHASKSTRARSQPPVAIPKDTQPASEIDREFFRDPIQSQKVCGGLERLWVVVMCGAGSR